MSSEHTLYIVATPIGNRDDLSRRAVEVLSNVGRIYAEDTRHSQYLLRHYDIRTPVTALHEHNELQQLESILEYLRQQGSAALISDAGTPLISDPGYRLVNACHANGISVSPVPGASALTAALCVCGLPTDRFQFVGFPPAKTSARQHWLAPLAELPHTVVMYEAPHRIVESLSDCVDVFGAPRQVAVAREMTKRFETILHGSLQQVLGRIESDADQQRGEFVVILAGKPAATLAEGQQSSPELDRVLQTLLPHLPVKTVARCAAELTGLPRRAAYQRAIALQQE